MIVNSSFEVSAPLDRTKPEGWVTTTVGSLVETTTFAVGPVEVGPAETFEYAWGADAAYRLDEFSAFTEPMDGWFLNDHLLVLPGSAACIFEGSAVESFSGWALECFSMEYGATDVVSLGPATADSFGDTAVVTSLVGTVAYFNTAAGASEGSDVETFNAVSKYEVRVTGDMQSLALVSAHSYAGAVDDQVEFQSTHELPSPLSTQAIPCWISVVAGDSIKVARVRSGDPITFSDAGTGTHYIVQDGSRCWTYTIA